MPFPNFILTQGEEGKEKSFFSTFFFFNAMVTEQKLLVVALSEDAQKQTHYSITIF